MRQNRKWTARITIAGETFEADGGAYDTLRETARHALNEAIEYVKAEFGSDASVMMYKQLKNDPEPREDRSGGYVWREGPRVFAVRGDGC